MISLKPSYSAWCDHFLLMEMVEPPMLVIDLEWPLDKS